MNAVDIRAEHWRQEQEIAAAAKALEALDRQAKRDQVWRQRRRRRSRGLSLCFRQPAWQKWIIYPVGLWVGWECFRVVFLGGQMR